MLEQIDVTEAREALLTVRRRVEQYAWLMNAYCSQSAAGWSSMPG